MVHFLPPSIHWMPEVGMGGAEVVVGNKAASFLFGSPDKPHSHVQLVGGEAL